MKAIHRLSIPKKLDLYQTLFGLIVFYYWVIQYFYAKGIKIDRFSILYFFTVIPILIYILANMSFVVRSKWYIVNKHILYYMLLVIAISFLRMDIVIVYNTLILCILFVIINNSKVYVSAKFVNILFYFSIIGSIITYHVGLNMYGYLPGMAKTNLYQGLSWRVSLFPSLPVSAFFSLIVFTRNFFSVRKTPNIYLILFLSTYFIVLSGSRSAIIGFLLVFIVAFTTKLFGFRNYPVYLVFSLLLVTTVIFSIIFSPYLANLSKTSNMFVKSLLFKTEKKSLTIEEVEEENYRTWIWSKHLELYKQNPLIGKGDYRLEDFLSQQERNRWRTSFSESFFTNMMVEVGLLALLFLAFVLHQIKTAINNQNKALYSLLLSFLILMFLYGSFIVPYNLVFLLFIGSFFCDAKSSKKTLQASSKE